MNFGFIKFFLLFLILAVGGIFAYLALVDMPVTQSEIIVDLPAEAAAPAVPVQTAP